MEIVIRDESVQAAVPLASYGFIKDFLGVLQAAGVSVGPSARKTRLPLLVDDPMQLIPKRPCFLFLDQVSTPELPVLGLATGIHSSAEGLVRSVIEAACVDGSTLLSGLRGFVRLIQTLANELPIDLELTSDGAWLWHRGLSAPADGSRPGILQLELYILGIFLSVLRGYLGSSWQPMKLQLQAARVPAELSRHLPRPVIQTGRARLAVWVPAADFAAKARRKRGGERVTTTGRPPTDLVCGLREAMIGYSTDPTCDFTLSFAAELAGMTERSLQRKLAVHGVRFRDLAGESMVESSKRHLRNESLTVRDVALAHGYSDPSHFVRAFNRFAGMTPGVYRRVLAG
jgi:AraC-like DNA-binding protein